jgi:hypothetical protein
MDWSIHQVYTRWILCTHLPTHVCALRWPYPAEFNKCNCIQPRATTCVQPTSRNSTILWKFLKVPRAFRLLTAFHTLSLRMLFRTLSCLEIFTSFCVFRCGGPFAAVALSLQNLFRCRTSFALDSAGLSKRPSWFFEVVLWSDTASLLHPPAATFTTLCEYGEDSPGYEWKASSTEQYKVTGQKKRVLENQLT